TMNPRLPIQWTDYPIRLPSFLLVAIGTGLACAAALNRVRATSVRLPALAPGLRFGSAWFLATLVPIVLLTTGAPDRYLYLPSAGLCWTVAGLLFALGTRAWQGRSRVAPVLSGLLLGLLLFVFEWNTLAELALGWVPAGKFTQAAIQTM